MTHVEALHNSNYTKTKCVNYITKTENLKSEQIQNFQSLEGLTTTFCLEKISMNYKVDEVADVPSIQYAEELSQTPSDPLYCKMFPLLF